MSAKRIMLQRLSMSGFKYEKQAGEPEGNMALKNWPYRVNPGTASLVLLLSKLKYRFPEGDFGSFAIHC